MVRTAPSNFDHFSNLFATSSVSSISRDFFSLSSLFRRRENAKVVSGSAHCEQKRALSGFGAAQARQFI
jgi:hypothetical protein